MHRENEGTKGKGGEGRTSKASAYDGADDAWCSRRTVGEGESEPRRIRRYVSSGISWGVQPRF